MHNNFAFSVELKEKCSNFLRYNGGFCGIMDMLFHISEWYPDIIYSIEAVGEFVVLKNAGILYAWHRQPA